MTAKELRIGNLVIINDEITTMEIGWFSAKSIKPIPLTEEWHNKFGIVRDGFNQFEYNVPRKNNFNIDILFTGYYVYIRQRSHPSGKLSHNHDLISIWNRDLTKRDMYVHEWQNLYFTLTGEELTINQ